MRKYKLVMAVWWVLFVLTLCYKINIFSSSKDRIKRCVFSLRPVVHRIALRFLAKGNWHHCWLDFRVAHGYLLIFLFVPETDYHGRMLYEDGGASISPELHWHASNRQYFALLNVGYNADPPAHPSRPRSRSEAWRECCSACRYGKCDGRGLGIRRERWCSSPCNDVLTNIDIGG